MPVDESSPGFVVKAITNAPELRLPGPIDVKTLGQALLDTVGVDVTDRVISFEYEEAERELDILRLHVDNEDLFFFDHPAFVKGNPVRVLFGYPGRIFGPRDAIVDSMRGFRTLTISCSVFPALANKAESEIFHSMRRTDVVRALVARGEFPGITGLDIDESSVVNEQPRDWQRSRQTAWQFIQRLAEDPGYEVYPEGEVLHFHPRRLARRPVRKYEYFYGSGEILSFDVTEYQTLDRAGIIQVNGRDPIERANLSATGSDATTRRDTVGGQGTLVIKALKTGDLVSGTKIVPSPKTDGAEIANLADAHYRLGEQAEVRATATILGDPLLGAKSIVEIVGISKALSGNYYIEKHVHRIDTNGGYRGTLTLVRNALTSLATSSPPTLDSAKAKDNRQDLSTDPRKSIVPNGDGSFRQEFK